MLRKLIIAVLVLAVMAAAVVSSYNSGLARTTQGGAAQAANEQVEQVVNSDSTTLSSTIGQTTAGNGQGGAGRNRGSGGTGNGQALAMQSFPPAGELSEAEADSLVFMVEEEKLARDVYLALYNKWGLAAFQNISLSEQTHMDAIGRLIDRYGLSSPVRAGIGSFTDPTFQALYNDLVGRGGDSLAEAIRVGGLIEEIDILDLQTRLGETDNADIQQVYNRLLNGSHNHLRAFSNTLSTQTGENYQPQKLGADEYQAVLSESQGGGNGRGRGNGRGGRGRA